MLKTLESNIESEIQEWQSKVEEREGEIKQVQLFIAAFFRLWIRRWTFKMEL